jgi:hypothetical protein
MKTSSSGGRFDSLTETVQYTEDTADALMSAPYSWGYETSEENSLTGGTLGFLNVTNYVQDAFRGNSDYTKKTARDLLVGFGDGVQGKHIVRPVLYGYRAWTGTDPAPFSVQYIIDKPRGSRFGQYNIEKQVGSYKFSYKHFGYMRDMLEQSIDTKYVNYNKNQRVYGSPVVVSAINIVNPEIPKLMENTSRYNKTVNATVVKPYIENNYEATPNPANLNSESLRVDVAGSIRTRGITAPGNMAGNIRSRG